MCEYCGCQSLPAIAELTAEHDRIVDLIGQVRVADRRGDIEAMIELCREISAVLGPHTLVEEHGLFPAMATEFPEQIAILEAEHRRIEVVLGEASDAVARTDPTWPARLIDVLTLLREHIFKEQDGVFPAALSTLSTAQWDRVGEVRDAAAVSPR
jgi:hemerythrin-like domain-containing protein